MNILQKLKLRLKVCFCFDVNSSLSVCRALFDYDGSASDLSAPNQALPFHFGDILHVSGAGEEEWWPARHLSPPPPNCPEVGVIPSRRRSELLGFLFGTGRGFEWFWTESSVGLSTQVCHTSHATCSSTFTLSMIYDHDLIILKASVLLGLLLPALLTRLLLFTF